MIRKFPMTCGSTSQAALESKSGEFYRGDEVLGSVSEWRQHHTRKQFLKMLPMPHANVIGRYHKKVGQPLVAAAP